MAVGNKFKLRLLGHGAATAIFHVSGTPITAAQIGDTANFTIQAANGTPPYVYAVSSGTLPTGQSINSSTGAVTGTLSAAATFSAIVLKATDATNAVVYLAPYTMTVTSPVSDFSVTVSPTTTGTIGTAITSYQAVAVGAGGTVTWAFDTANNYTPPTGITINSSSGLVSGTPSALTDGTYRMRIKATTASPVGTAYSTVYQMVVEQATSSTLIHTTLTPANAYTTTYFFPTSANSAVFTLNGQTARVRKNMSPLTTGADNIYAADSLGFATGPDGYKNHDPTDTAYFAALNPPGVLPRQDYPLRSGSTKNLTVRGGRVAGECSHIGDQYIMSQTYPHFNIPGTAGQYENSAAVFCDGGSAGNPSTGYTVQRMRMDHVWDAFRLRGITGAATSHGLYHHYIDGCWISYVVDDGVELDASQSSLDITDSLFDNCHGFISADLTIQGGYTSHELTDLITVNGCLIRLIGRPTTDPTIVTTGGYDYFAPFKFDSHAPSLSFTNSIIAVDNYSSSRASRWLAGWQRMTNTAIGGSGSYGSGNYFLWMSSAARPTTGPIAPANDGATDGTGIPPSFTILTGQTAIDYWASARSTWIAAHPYIMRMDTDTE